MHEHTEKCLDGCIHLALQNMFWAALIDHKDNEENDHE